MGLWGELYSSRVLLPNRTYFFNVKENRVGDLYLNIVESKNRDEGGFDRQSVILFADDLKDFLKGFDEALRVLEKEVRERRHKGGQSSDARSSDARPVAARPVAARPSAARPAREDRRKEDKRKTGRPKNGKRVVVKKV